MDDDGILIIINNVLLQITTLRQKCLFSGVYPTKETVMKYVSELIEDLDVEDRELILSYIERTECFSDLYIDHLTKEINTKPKKLKGGKSVNLKVKEVKFC